MTNLSQQVFRNRLGRGKAKRIRMMLLFLSFLTTAYCLTSEEKTFVKTFGGSGPDRGVHIIQSSDGNFVIVGNTMTESNKLDVYLLKCNSSGDTLWTQTFGGQEDDNGWCVKETADQGYIITGFTESFGASMNDILLLKTDADGKKQWHKTIGGSGDDIAWSIAINQDEGYTIAAQTNSFGSGDLDAYLIRTDAFGDTLWTRTFGGPEIDRVFSVDLADDGSILLAGISYSYGAGDRDAYLIKTDRFGDLLWQNTYGGPGYDNAHSVLVNRENEIILTGYGDHWGEAGKMDMFLKKITLAGEDIWTQTYGGEENDRAMTVFQLQDGGYILTGFTQSFGEGNWDVYVIKTGSTGEALWNDTHGSPAADFGYDIIQSREGDYYITGWSHGFGHPEGNLLLIKTCH